MAATPFPMKTRYAPAAPSWNSFALCPIDRWCCSSSAAEPRRSRKSPFPSSLTLSDIVETYRALVHSGAPIAEINAIRKHLSAIKGGRMAQAAAPATQVSLLVSDVPDNSLDALASGPTMPDSSTVSDCYAIAERYGMLAHFPDPRTSDV